MFEKEGSKNGHFQTRKILKIAFLRLLETFLKGNTLYGNSIKGKFPF